MPNPEAKQPNPPPVDLQQWYDASTLFATTAQRFCDLSVSLEMQCSTADWKLPDLVTRIDSLQSTLDVQLVRARIALINIRNKLSGCSILHLPDEILSDIFIQYVYAPSEGHTIDTMDRRIDYIYQRVHTLLGVCTAWRRVGIACRDLWAVVPLADSLDTLRYRPLSTQLSLQRASHRNLHLAVSAHHSSHQRLEILARHWHRFSGINISSGSGSDISNYLHPIAYPSPGFLSKLSIKINSRDWRAPRLRELVDLDTGTYRLIASLSVFRISGFRLHWDRITFSHRLVELRIADTVLHSYSVITSLFSALSSASELKILKLISVVSYSPTSLSTVPVDVVSLPKLELLHLESLYFNILELILSHITRGSYHLTLGLHRESSRECPDTRAEDVVGADRLNALLKNAAIDELILSGGGYYPFFWASPTGLQAALQSVPGLKTLVLNQFVIDAQLLTGLKPPPNTTFPAHKGAFPQLTRLEIHDADLVESLIDLKPTFKAVFDSHQLQTLVLGGSLRLREWAYGKPLDENDVVLQWMRHSVPQFKFSKESGKPEAKNMWLLWDI